VEKKELAVGRGERRKKKDWMKERKSVLPRRTGSGIEMAQKDAQNGRREEAMREQEGSMGDFKPLNPWPRERSLSLGR